MIPAKVIGKFSIRIVPNQTPAEVPAVLERSEWGRDVDLMSQVNAKVKAYIEGLHKASGSPNSLRVLGDHGGMPWVSDVAHANYQAGIKATEAVYGIKPDLTREGGSIPVTLTLQAQSPSPFPGYWAGLRGGGGAGVHGQERDAAADGGLRRHGPLPEREAQQEQLHPGHQAPRRLHERARGRRVGSVHLWGIITW